MILLSRLTESEKIFNKNSFCNRTESVSKYCVSVKHSALEHMISFYFYVMNWFFRTIQETIKHYISNSIIELNDEYFNWIQLSNLIIKNVLEFDYMFNSYCMWYIRIEAISSIKFLSYATSCTLQRLYSLAINRILFFL